MEYASPFLTVAEVALGFVGFVAIFVVLRDRSGAFSDVDLFAVRLIVEISLATLFFALPAYGAVTTGNAAMLKHLLAAGAQPDLKLAIDLKQLGVARQLLEQAADQIRTVYCFALTSCVL